MSLSSRRLIRSLYDTHRESPRFAASGCCHNGTVRRGSLPALLLTVLAGSALAADDEAHRRFVRRVNDAIDRGVLYLVKQQREDGSWAGYESRYPMGMTSLALLTVLKCDYPRDSAVVKKAFKLLYERFKDQHAERLKTYSVAILMMAIEEAYAPREERKISVSDRYGEPRRLRKVQLPNFEYKWMAKLARWMVSVRTDTIWRYPGGGTDLSNTQYALLGLAAALRCGIKIPRETFLESAKYLLDMQEKDGPEVRRIVHLDQGPGYATRYATNLYDRARGWGYVSERDATGSMTTAGVSSLAICRSELMSWAGYEGPFGERLERGIRDGLAWLTKHFSVTGNPPGGRGWHYYYLYGLERAAVLADVRFLGDHDWYREGAEYLVRAQRRAGHWNNLTDTCFALLFLRRATVPVKVPKAVTPKDD
jgi:hypothetical protein